MSRLCACYLLALLPAAAVAELQVVVIEGLGGDANYTAQFAAQVAAVGDAAGALTTSDRVKLFRSGGFSRDDVLQFFDDLGGDDAAPDRLAVFLVGHGSYDDVEYKFNIAGPDLTGTDLADALDRVPVRNQLLVNTSSSSGALLERLKSDERVVILATRSGAERHAPRFGNYFAAALSEPGADIDKNRAISAEEAFRFAERAVSDFFERNGQLATEHARLEGTDAARFTIARLGTARPTTGDPVLRGLIAQREQLNADIEDLRLRRDALAPADYQSELLGKMLELATLEEEIERRERGTDDEE